MLKYSHMHMDTQTDTQASEERGTDCQDIYTCNLNSYNACFITYVCKSTIRFCTYNIICFVDVKVYHQILFSSIQSD